MRKIFTLFLFLTVTLSVSAQSPELLKFMTFNGLENQVKAGYGSKEDPILSGAFINIKDLTQSIKLKSSYRWQDGKPIDFSKRFSTRSPDNSVILDCYTLIRPGTTDTIRLYVDAYHTSSKYYVPSGLTALTMPVLKTEIAPYLALVERLESSSDAITLKEEASTLLKYISTNLGTKPFTDKDLSPFFEDKEIDPALKSFLFRAYIFNKFYAYGKSLGEEEKYARNKMKLNLDKFLIVHPDVKIGGLKEFFK